MTSDSCTWPWYHSYMSAKIFFLNSRQWQYQLLTIMWNKGNFMLTGVKIAKASFILWNRVKEMNTCDPQIHSRVYILEGAGPWAPEHWPCTSSTVTIAKKRKLETTQISPAEEWIHKLCFIHDNATQQWKRRNCSVRSLDNLGNITLRGKRQRTEGYTQNYSIAWGLKTCKLNNVMFRATSM